jgi:hypothetical protein
VIYPFSPFWGRSLWHPRCQNCKILGEMWNVNTLNEMKLDECVKFECICDNKDLCVISQRYESFWEKCWVTKVTLKFTLGVKV